MRHAAPWLVFWLALLPGVCRAASATPAVIAEIQAALDKGDAQQAGNLADTALKDGVSTADRGRLLLYRGLAEELMDRHGDAMVDFSSALETRALPADDREEAQLQRGFLRDGLGELESAASDYSVVIAMKGASLSTALTDRANIYRRQNRLPEAKRDYQAALAAGRGRPQYAWYGLGQIAETQHDLTAARGFYAKAVSADPGYAEAGERLTELGGPPDGAINDTAPVILHPPGSAQIPAQAPTLHPPGTRKIAQHLSGPAAFASQPALSLRPALDAAAHGTAGVAAGQVQLGAWRSQGEAEAGWAKARARAGAVLAGISPVFVTADIPAKGRYVRLRVTSVARNREQFCAELVARGVACIPARD